MKRRVLSLLSACLLGTSLFATAEPAVPSGPEQFQVNEKTTVPNVTLTPGSYSIRIVDHLRDRVILQVTGKNNHIESTFLAIPASTMANAPVGPIAYGNGPKGKAAALKGFSFPGGVAVEFVYPKNDAVSIAQANSTRVMAIDPASEGRKPAAKLSQDDMNMITLWMLEPSRVGPGEKTAAISASKYQAPAPAAAPQAPVETAQAAPAPAPETAMTGQPAPPSTTASVTPSRFAAHRSRPVQLAQNDVPPPPAPVRTHTRPANVKALPHTGSDLPWLWLGAFGFLGLGASLSARRRFSTLG